MLRNVQKVDCSSELYGRKVRMPVLIAPVGGLQICWAGGVATVAEAAGEFGIPMMQSSATEPTLEETAKRAPEAYKIFQLYVRGDDKCVDDDLPALAGSRLRAAVLLHGRPRLLLAARARRGEALQPHRQPQRVRSTTTRPGSTGA